MKFLLIALPLLLIGCAPNVVEPGPTPECLQYYGARLGVVAAQDVCK